MEQTARVLDYRRRSENPVPATGPATFGWSMLGWVGLVLIVIGGQDLLLALIPLKVGNPEWEFGTVTAALNGMPVLSMGLALVLGWAAVSGRKWLLRTVAVVLLLLAAVVLVAFTLYALTVPMALKSVTQPDIELGLQKAIAKTAVQAVLYPLVFVAMGIAAFRYSPHNS